VPTPAQNDELIRMLYECLTAPEEGAEPKHPPKHGFKNFNCMYWNAHCQFWQKQKPFPLGYECEKKYGKGPFVRGYHAPGPYAGQARA
jgi:hypothetical protein